MIKSYERLKKQNKEKISVPKSAQDLIDIDTIYKDGIFCSKNKYSKTYRFKDINYSIASKDEKVGLFLNYSELLNSLDSSTMTKITINNRKINIKEFQEKILIPLRNDHLDKYRKEYNDMLLEKVSGADGKGAAEYDTDSGGDEPDRLDRHSEPDSSDRYGKDAGGAVQKRGKPEYPYFAARAVFPK